MTRLLLRCLWAISAAVFLSAGHGNNAPKDERDNSGDVFKTLRSGGFVLVMRHAHSPSDQDNSKGYSEGCVLAPGRGLDETGLLQGQLWSALIEKEQIPILKAYTSHYCRAWDTAAALSGNAEVAPHPSQVTTDPDKIALFKVQVEHDLDANPGSNVLLVSHSNIAPLYGAAVKAGEDELPEGVMSIVDPETWGTIARVSVMDDNGNPSVIVN